MIPVILDGVSDEVRQDRPEVFGIDDDRKRRFRHDVIRQTPCLGPFPGRVPRLRPRRVSHRSGSERSGLGPPSRSGRWIGGYRSVPPNRPTVFPPAPKRADKARGWRLNSLSRATSRIPLTAPMGERNSWIMVRMNRDFSRANRRTSEMSEKVTMCPKVSPFSERKKGSG